MFRQHCPVFWISDLGVVHEVPLKGTVMYIKAKIESILTEKDIDNLVAAEVAYPEDDYHRFARAVQAEVLKKLSVDSTSLKTE